MSQLLSPYRELKLNEYESSWTSPANIAFVKYWGKKAHQIPANPSLSMTLKECTTTTKSKFFENDQLSVKLKFNGKSEDKFALKIRDYLESLQVELPWVMRLGVEIETSNTFPHGAGIASSTSGMCAFSFTLADYLKNLRPDGDDVQFFKRASFLARLASGSACRSVYGGYTTWGDSELPQASDEFAMPLSVHSDFQHLNDTVLVLDSQEKSISSRAGHDKMREHVFAQARFEQGKVNFSRCVGAMKAGDMETLGEILESEALSLHAMMLTSPRAYTLLRPKTLAAIEAIWDFRKNSQLPLYFTLDAGPNLHLIYPESYKNKIYTFITHELAPLAEKLIDDRTGEGPLKC